MATLDPPPPENGGKVPPGSSFAETKHIAWIASYLVLVGIISLWMLIARWPRCVPEPVQATQSKNEAPPETTNPSATEPSTTEPSTTEPGMTEPGTTEPGGTERGTEGTEMGTETAATAEANPSLAKRPGCDPIGGGDLLLLVALAGALAGALHAARSLYYYVGNRYFKQSWTLMYLLLPFVGAALASIFYIVFIAGLYDPQKGDRPLLIVGVAALVGMFSEQAVEKLKKIAEAIFTAPPPAKDKVPVVKVTNIDPKSGKTTGKEEVTITGEGFAAGTRVFFGEKEVVPKTIEPTKLVVVAPEHPEGKVNVIVDVPGSSPCAVVNGYEYVP